MSESILNIHSASLADYVKKINDSGLIGFLKLFSLVKGSVVKGYDGNITFSGNTGSKSISYIDFINYVYRRTGGNYRALELFLELIKRRLNLLRSLSDSMEKFEKETREIFLTILKYLSKDLIFNALWGEFNERGRMIVSLLSKFTLPVEKYALIMQGFDELEISSTLEKAVNLTLTERHGERTYYVTPLIAELIQNSSLTPYIDINYKKAGDYYWDYLMQGNTYKAFLAEPASLILIKDSLHGELRTLVERMEKLESNSTKSKEDSNTIDSDELYDKVKKIVKGIHDFFYSQPNQG
jgi:hypothetical protein